MAAFVHSIASLIVSVNQVALNPIVASSGLAALKYGPESITLPFLKEAVHISRPQKDKIRALLKVLLAIGIARTVNRALNAVATNNWRIWATTSAWSWHNEIAVVTGGCSGIGKSTVQGLAKRGIRVAVLDLQALPHDMASDGNIHYFKCDITSTAAVAEAAAAIRQKLGNPSILINNAGLARSGPLLSSTDEGVRKLFAVNLLAMWTTTREFLPSMVEQNKGHVVTIASMASFVMLEGATDYCASKAGALAFHEGLAFEIRRTYKAPGVVATVVHPSWVNTNMIARAVPVLERIRGTILRPEDISNRVVDQILSCRGGQIIVPPHLSGLSGVRGWPNWMQELYRELRSLQI